ncbi:Non-classical phosphatidylinositol transfer protein (PITP) [Knufia fluminis]|uniref:Phosphatidylinositol transfer protein SFH5 n=1 Tax=Knufia fluminis TaxID=191047 RepID=A0AAN8FA69_9EURO|nr:Non-classical phosphatidylinositol transfer protein (PITP) [Knufia fluminis]
MPGNEAEHGTTAAPDNTTLGAEVSSVVPDSSNTASKSSEKQESTPAATGLSQSGDAAAISASNAVAAAPGPAVVGEQTPPAEATKTGAKDEATEDKKEADSPIQALWAYAQGHDHKEIWGVNLADPATHVPSQIILQKYLNANDQDLARAKEQLKNTLDWRATNKPSELTKKTYASDKFAGLGYITSYPAEGASPDNKAVFTWNIYGGVKDIQKSFGDLDAFINWRVALMEVAMIELDLSSATKPITADDDPYKIYQVHDYKRISFLRSPPAVRSAAKKTVEVLAMAYPETLREKFFVNVPAIMGFMYGVMKLFVAPKTIKKFHPMSNGSLLVHEFGDSKVTGLGEKLPKEYGGKGDELCTVGKQLSLE